jgi:antitoxin ParD1/3/4
MVYAIPNDVERLIDSFMATGQYSNRDDVLRDALQALVRQEADLAAIREGLADIEAGRHRPFEEIDAELREQFRPTAL